MRNFQEIGLPDKVFPSNAEIGRMVGASREMISKLRTQIKSRSQSAQVASA